MRLRAAERQPPQLFVESLPIYRWYEEIDRDGMSGVPTFRGMNAVLDEYGIKNLEDRAQIRRQWRAMFAKEHELRKKPADVNPPS